MSNDNIFKNGAPVYVFTNENIAGYMPALGDIKGARVLSVGASGDHAFESYLAGASHVDTFDINSNQKNIIELKTHMIRHLPYEKFTEFFLRTNNFFNQKILSPIKNEFSDDLNEFLAQYERRGNRMFWNPYGISSGFDMFKISYLQDPNKYYELRKRLPEKISFTNCDIRDISAKFTQEYDVILLSNIVDYVYGTIFHEHSKLLPFFYRDVIVPMSHKNLTYENGRICFEYLWSAAPYRCNKVIQEMQNDLVLRKMHNHHHKIVGVPVRGADHGSVFDYAIILKQRER